MTHRGRRTRVLAAVVTGLSAVLLAAFFTVQATRDQPTAAAPPMPSPDASRPVERITTPDLPSSAPVRLEVPRIDVRTPLMKLAENPDRTIETPPLSRAQVAGWYRLGAAPGSRGAAVIIGHVDTTRGPGVFYRLGRLRPGDRTSVLRADGRTAVFEIDSVEHFGKDSFPTNRVYGDPGYAAIRLITCGGRFDPVTGHYVDNVIAFGHLLRSDEAR
ncbi:class F sortase [Actinomadura graeca]|uniref:Class F sortase n=1 Tax=Actinomadura graeca TaxID=2750812 RepID=A0ABX8R383_9ACTN|nr:class F sortase [Actinomadura graeca]QXJ23468.1 class F sortase [Actinomadura graeca]